MAHILSLPPEVLSAIFRHLHPLDLVSVGAALPHWMEVVNQLVLLPWGHWMIMQDQQSFPEEEALLQNIHTLHLLDVVSINDLSSRLTRLETVWIHGLSHRNIFSDINLPILKCINFRKAPDTPTLLGDMTVSQFHPELRSQIHFDSDCCTARSVRYMLPEVTPFLEQTVLIVENSIFAVYSHHWSVTERLDIPRLENYDTLHLTATGLGSSAYKDITHCLALRNLSIEDGRNLDDAAMLSLTPALRSLKSLKLIGAPGVSSACWSRIIQGGVLTNLRSLQLRECPGLDDECFIQRHSAEHQRSLNIEFADVDLQENTLSRESVRELLRWLATPRKVTIALPASEALFALPEAPHLLPRLTQLTVRVQAAGSNSVEAEKNIRILRAKLREECHSGIRLDVHVTFLRLATNISSSEEE